MQRGIFIRTVACKKKAARQGCCRARLMEAGLEDELASEFKGSGVIRAGDLTEAAFGGTVGIEALEGLADVVELRVVEGVEGLHAKLEAGVFSHSKRLVDRRVEVDATRTNDCVLASVAEALG